jgi:hypothetical protein
MMSVHITVKTTGFMDFVHHLILEKDHSISRRLHNEELHNLCPSPSFIRVIKSIRVRGAGHVARMKRDEKCIQYFGLKTRREAPLGIRWIRWEDLKEIG